MILILLTYLQYLGDYYYLKNKYSENITLEEVKAIYDKCGIKFYDLVSIQEIQIKDLDKEYKISAL